VVVEPDGYSVYREVDPDEVLADAEEAFDYEGRMVADFKPDLFLTFNMVVPPFNARVTRVVTAEDNPKAITVYFKRIVTE
jgi:hypothetical protein